MHVSWKLAEVSEGKSLVYKELYLATQLFQSHPTDNSAASFSQAIHERLQEFYKADGQAVVMVLVTVSCLRPEATVDARQVLAETPLFDPPPKQEWDSDVKISGD